MGRRGASGPLGTYVTEYATGMFPGWRRAYVFAEQRPALRVHQPMVLQTQALPQSAAEETTHLPLAAAHSPATAQRSDARQWASLVATHAPFCAVQRPRYLQLMVEPRQSLPVGRQFWPRSVHRPHRLHPGRSLQRRVHWPLYAMHLPRSLQATAPSHSVSLTAMHLSSRAVQSPLVLHWWDRRQSRLEAATHTPFFTAHLPSRLHASDLRQWPWDAATHARSLVAHLPSFLHASDLRQRPLEPATHLPRISAHQPSLLHLCATRQLASLAAEHWPEESFTHCPRSLHSTLERRQSSSEPTLHWPLTALQPPCILHSPDLPQSASEVATQLSPLAVHRPQRSQLLVPIQWL